MFANIKVIASACIALLCFVAPAADDGSKAAPAEKTAELVVEQPNEKTLIAGQFETTTAVRVTLPGKFSADFNFLQGFSHFFDLAHDPERKHNIGASFAGSGMFWFILYPITEKSKDPEIQKKHQHDFANPPRKISVLESNDVRARVQLSGKFTPNGGGGASPPGASSWNDIDYVETYTIYPTGNFYLGIVLNNNKNEDCLCARMDIFLNSTSQWTTLQNGGVMEMKRFADAAPEKPHAWIAHSSNGPTYFEDIALIMSRGRYESGYWENTFSPYFTRTALGIWGANDEATFKKADKDGGLSIPPGESRMAMLYRFANDMKDAAAVQPHADDYRTPDTLESADGEADKTESGDENHDGFNEEEGCYVMKVGANGVDVSIHGTASAPRLNPVFKVKGWKGGVPSAVTLNGAQLENRKGYHVAVVDGALLVQVFATISSVTKFRLVP